MKKLVQWFKLQMRIRKGFRVLIVGFIISGIGAILAFVEGGLGPVGGHFVHLATEVAMPFGFFTMFGGGLILASKNDDTAELEG
jgi:hypothetical protein